ncbi:MAG: hypothetical protein K2W99_00080 [Chthoniobacterales bacterium]|nr:hypothetical protein [Chthoniobacterales bacterium]
MNFDITPAHLHLMLNHIPIIGILVASFPILIGILAQCRTTIAAGLLATLLCAAAMPTIMESGSKAAHAYKDGSLLPALDEAGKAALHMHASRADKTTPVVYASALLAVLALLALIKFPIAARWLALAVLLGNAGAVLLAVWTADAGGRIRHLELRPPTPWDEPAKNMVVPLSKEPTPPTVISSETPTSSTSVVVPEASSSPSETAPEASSLTNK